MRTTPLYLYPTPSKYLLIFLSALHAGSCCSLILTDLPCLPKITLLIFCILSYIHHLRIKQVISLSVTTENHWCLVDERGEIKTGVLCVDSIATGWLVILNFKSKEGKGHRFSLVLPVDALSSDDYRRLRARLFALSHAGLLV